MDKTIEYIIRAVSQNYGMDNDTARETVNKSFMIELIQSDYEFVTHYDAFYWADEIMKNNITA